MAKSKVRATLVLTITYTETSLMDLLEHAREVIEKSKEQASVQGYMDLNHAERIFIEDLE